MSSPPKDSMAIATCTRYATQAGMHIARAGGNAFDAAVACAFNLMVSNPLMTSFGGGGVATVKAAGQAPVNLHFFSRMPGKGLPPERFSQNIVKLHIPHGPGVEVVAGHASVSVPGTVKGLEALLQRYGTMPLQTILEPTIADARQGVPLNGNIANWMRTSCRMLHWHTPYSEKLLSTETGEIPTEGYPLKNPDLADTLEALAVEGSDLVYRGEIARKFSEVVQSGGGLLTMADLADYEINLQAPLETHWKDWQIYTAAPPSIGGCTLLQMLKFFPQINLTNRTPAYYSQLTRIIQATMANRFAIFQNSRDNLDKMGDMLSDAYLDTLYADLKVSPNTTQIATLDRQGNACSITLSLGYGSGVAIDGTGIYTDNILGELELNPFGLHGLPPGTPLITGMAPSIAVNPDQSDLLAIGTPGASRIAPALLQVLINLLWFGDSLKDAVDAPRIHWEDNVVSFEPGIAPEPAGLPPQWEMKPFDQRHFYFGGVQAVRLSEAGFDAVSDPRRSGYSLRG